MARELFAVISLNCHDNPTVFNAILQTLATCIGEDDELCYVVHDSVMIVWRECHHKVGF